MRAPDFAISVPLESSSQARFSICTLVTNFEEYRAMVDSFVAGGFLPEFCEYIYCDNSSGNRFDAFTAYNHFLDSAMGTYLVLCHQDILLLSDGIEKLERVIKEINQRDPDWALLGNAGGVALDQVAMVITHADGTEHRTDDLPTRVESLDENFLVVKRSANLALSRDLKGFHFYGTELCQIAIRLGYSAWVVDFHLLHKSTGNFDPRFLESYEAIARKYRRTHRDGYIQTTCAIIPTGNSKWRRWKVLFFRLRFLQSAGSDSLEARQEMQRLLAMIGPFRFAVWNALFMALCGLTAPVRLWSKCRSDYMRLHFLQRHAPQTEENLAEAIRLRQSLGSFQFLLHRAVFAVATPFCNMVRSIRKRLF